MLACLMSISVPTLMWLPPIHPLVESALDWVFLLNSSKLSLELLRLTLLVSEKVHSLLNSQVVFIFFTRLFLFQPFLTSSFIILDEVGKHLGKVGHEFGTTTGRPRRCGWLDIPLLRYSHMINNYTSLNITKLDVLD